MSNQETNNSVSLTADFIIKQSSMVPWLNARLKYTLVLWRSVQISNPIKQTINSLLLLQLLLLLLFLFLFLLLLLLLLFLFPFLLPSPRRLVVRLLVPYFYCVIGEIQNTRSQMFFKCWPHRLIISFCTYNYVSFYI